MQASELLSLGLELLAFIDGGEGPRDFPPSALPALPPSPAPSDLPNLPVVPNETQSLEPEPLVGSAVNWGNLQSLVQISVALNAAYFSISQFSNPDIAKYKSRIASAQSAITSKMEEGGQRKDMLGSLSKLDNDIVSRQSSDRKFLSITRIFCATFFVLGLMILFLLSVLPNREAGFWIISVSALMNMPVLFGVFYMAFISMRDYIKIEYAIFSIEDELRKKISQVEA